MSHRIIMGLGMQGALWDEPGVVAKPGSGGLDWPGKEDSPLVWTPNRIRLVYKEAPLGCLWRVDLGLKTILTD